MPRYRLKRKLRVDRISGNSGGTAVISYRPGNFINSRVIFLKGERNEKFKNCGYYSL